MASEGEPEPKRIRSSEPDLKVVIGSEDDNSGAGDGEGKTGDGGDAEKQQANMVTKWYHSQTLATKSKYIDALLAAPMKESESRTITFPNITPATWELMMKFIDNPLASRTMKAKDVIMVAKYYDKYEFAEGTKLCDHVLEEYFKAVTADHGIVASDVDFFVDAVVVANDANLKQSFEAGIALTWGFLCTENIPVGRTAFTAEHMKMLAPLMNETADDARSWDLFHELAGERYEYKSDGFPEKFVGDCSDYFAHQSLISFISSIELSGADCENPFSGGPNGHFKPEDDDYSFSLRRSHFSEMHLVQFDGVHQHVFIRRPNKEVGWVMVFKRAADDVETVAYRFPLSGNLSLPPSKGWISVHPLAKGNPTLRYHLTRNIVEV